VRKEAFWLLSNVAAGTSDQIELILKQHKSMEKLQHGLIKESPEVIENFLKTLSLIYPLPVDFN